MVLGVNSYVCRSYKGKIGKGGLFAPHPIKNDVKTDKMLDRPIMNNKNFKQRMEHFKLLEFE